MRINEKINLNFYNLLSFAIIFKQPKFYGRPIIKQLWRKRRLRRIR